jgi:hypothetical protein
LLQYTQKGKLYYDFFKKKDGNDWVVIGSDGEYGARLFNLSRGAIPYHCGPINQFVYRNVLVNPTGEYLMLVPIDWNAIEFVSIKSDNRHSWFIMLIEDEYREEENGWYEIEEFYTLQDGKLDHVEWVSDYRLVYRIGIYELTFDVEDPSGDVKLEWRHTTLFKLLSRIHSELQQ